MVLAPSIDVAPEGTQQAILIANRDFISKRADAGRRFMKAYLDGARDYLAALEQGKDKERLFQVIEKWTKVKADVASRLGYPYIDPTGRLNEKATMAQFDYLHQIGVLQKKVNDIGEIVDYSLLPR